MRLIDADKLKKLFDEIVDQHPTVDAVPVIRCKDCKHYKPQYYSDGSYAGNCRYVWVAMADDGFCHMGQRKEE